MYPSTNVAILAHAVATGRAFVGADGSVYVPLTDGRIGFRKLGRLLRRGEGTEDRDGSMLGEILGE